MMTSILRGPTSGKSWNSPSDKSVVCGDLRTFSKGVSSDFSAGGVSVSAAGTLEDASAAEMDALAAEVAAVKTAAAADPAAATEVIARASSLNFRSSKNEDDLAISPPEVGSVATTDVVNKSVV